MSDLINDEEWRLVQLDRLGLKEDPFKLVGRSALPVPWS